MKIIHSVQFDDEEVQTLFELARIVGEVQMTPTYSDAEKLDFTSSNFKQFKDLLSDYAHESFSHGMTSGVKKKKDKSA